MDLENDSMFSNNSSGHLLSVRDSDDFANDGSLIQPGHESFHADFYFDQQSIPDISELIEDSSMSTTSVFSQLDPFGYPPTGMPVSNPAQTQKPTEVLEGLTQPGAQDNFPHISALGKIIGVLEEHIQNKQVSIDEIMRINKVCMTKITEIANLEAFKHCKSCTMLVFTAMDLILTLYDTAISEHARSGSDPAPGQPIGSTRGKEVSLQFGVFQFDPEDLVMFRNQIVRHELERCVKVIQGQSTELRNSNDRSTPNIKVHQQLFSVIENRARILASSLR